ncbi:hypothetical protein HA402_009517 [Bradysia odoriphaga]|nr:hypothetical protein HA402_009517 [Bradysia odoriphaga]
MALEKFCFCCKLRNGVFIWGSLCIIRSFVVFVTTVASGVASEDVFNETVNMGGYDDSNDALSYASSAYSIYKTGTSAVFLLIVTASVVDFISSVLLVVGAVKV